jgi:hypothetical protein
MVSVSCLLSIATWALVAEADTRTYRRRQGDKVLETTFRIQRTVSGYELFKQNREEKTSIVLGPAGETISWDFQAMELPISFKAVRHGRRIKIVGTKDGRSVQESVRIDDKPWYQDVGFSAKDFIVSGESSRTFWMLHPKKLSAHQMKLTRMTTDSLAVDGRQEKVVKSKLTIDNFFLARWWSAYHWHRQSDGLFVKYQGRGRRGEPDVVVNIVR